MANPYDQFDPNPYDEFVAKPRMGKPTIARKDGGAVKQGFLSFANGVAANFLDRGAAALGTILPDMGPSHASVWEGKGLKDAYNLNLQQVRGYQDEERKRRPILSAVSEAAGAVGPMIASGGGTGAAQGGRLANFTRSVAPDVGYGVAYGVGSSKDLTKGKDVAKNAAIGAGSALAGNLIGRGVAGTAGAVITPRIARPEVQRLAQRGITMTPGQRGGALKRWGESAVKSVPVAGSLIRHAERRGVEQFNRAWVNEAVAPVGAQLPNDVAMGRDAMRWAQQAVEDGFDNALAPVNAQIDNAYQAGMQTVAQRAAQLPPAEATTFNYVMQNEITPLIPQTGVLNGQSFQNISRTLRTRAAGAGNLGTPAGDMLSDNLLAAHDELLGLIGRTNPDQLPQYLAANDAYANMARVNDAFTKTSQGEMADLVTPSQAYGAVKRRGYGTTTNRVAAGEARMQGLVDDARRVLPDTLPNSGTPERAAFLAMLGGAAPFSPIGAGVGAASMLPYIPGIDQFLQNRALAARPVRTAIGNGANQLAAPLGLFGGALGATNPPR